MYINFRVYRAISLKDDEEIKFFIDIFIDLCETHMETIHAEYRIDLFRLVGELSIHSPVESKII
jgi:hypothetical protein